MHCACARPIWWFTRTQLVGSIVYYRMVHNGHVRGTPLSLLACRRLTQPATRDRDKHEEEEESNAIKVEFDWM